jgi:tRNA-Thr(GGU) m(6)t(6)A37 methyltransferase TsaA
MDLGEAGVSQVDPLEAAPLKSCSTNSLIGPQSSRSGDAPSRVAWCIGPIWLRRIGVVRSPLTDLAAAPRQGDEGAPDAVVVIDAAFADAARDLQAGDRIMVVTWLHLADRAILAVHPRDDASRPMTGVFATRSSDRPNPLGLHEVEILAVDGPNLHVRSLEAIDGTPVVDIKPTLGPPKER